MRDILLQVVVMAACVAGCSKKATSSATGTTGSAAAGPIAAGPTAAKVADSPAPAAGSAASECDELGKVVEQHVPVSHADHTKAIVECMVDLCNSDKWSHDVIACIDKAPFDAKACQPNLTPDQYKHLSTAIAAEFGSDGAPGAL